MSEAFDNIPYEDLEQPFTILGTGSFGSVYRSTYLGLPVALKQVNPSTDYDVHKYFEREWRLMREARHPNVVLYLGLSKTVKGDVYIVSEFVEGGNLRTYIHNKRKPFPWRMRVSFATDIARALAYLHARKCIHRDLKPENLLLTSNGRVKITDFGFARIAPRSQEEVRRLTFCGTDSYMSPEILMGETFGIATDIFSLGVIFAEIVSRTLADDHHLKRSAPVWMIDPTEIRSTASDGAPPAFVELAIDCMKYEPEERPTMAMVLDVLRKVEMEVASRGDDADTHVGTIKFATGGRRPGMAPRIPSFGQIVQVGNGKPLQIDTTAKPVIELDDSDDDSDDADLEAVMNDLELNLGKVGAEQEGPYSTSVVRAHSHYTELESSPSNMSSTLTIKPLSPRPNSETEPLRSSESNLMSGALPPSVMSIDSYRTAQSAMSVAVATIGGDDHDDAHSTIASLPRRIEPSPSLMFHRFTMIKPGSKPNNSAKRHSISSAAPLKPTPKGGVSKRHSLIDGFGWSPFDFFLGKSRNKGNAGSSVPLGNPSAKCDLCGKKLGLGYKTVLECDDCGLRTHIKCGEFAPSDCGMRLHPQGNRTQEIDLRKASPLRAAAGPSTPRK